MALLQKSLFAVANEVVSILSRILLEQKTQTMLLTQLLDLERERQERDNRR